MGSPHFGQIGVDLACSGLMLFLCALFATPVLS
jgi:hypothetical protein